MNETRAEARVEKVVNLSKKREEALATEMVLNNHEKTAEKISATKQNSRSLAIDLAVFQFDMLYNSNKIEAAEELLEKEVRNHPCALPLLLRLGQLDELKGQYLNAFDLYRQAAVFAETEQERNTLYGALLRTRSHLRAEKISGPNHYIIRIEGNGSPVELHYDLKEEQRREQLYRTVSTLIDRRAGRVLEIECASGAVSRGLAREGYLVEAASSSMTDLILAAGIETYQILESFRPEANTCPEEALQGLEGPAAESKAAYFNLALDRNTARTIEASDVIMLLPAEVQFYLSKGPMEAAALLQLLAARAGKQLFFYLPPGHSRAYRAFCSKLLTILKHNENLLKSGRSFSLRPGLEYGDGGKLYLADLN